MGKIKMAFIGVGDMGSHHCIGFDLLEESEVRYICDMNEANVARTLAELKNSNPTIVSDYHELLAKEDLDAVVISVPNYLHREVAVAFWKLASMYFWRNRSPIPLRTVMPL